MQENYISSMIRKHENLVIAANFKTKEEDIEFGLDYGASLNEILCARRKYAIFFLKSEDKNAYLLYENCNSMIKKILGL